MLTRVPEAFFDHSNQQVSEVIPVRTSTQIDSCMRMTAHVVPVFPCAAPMGYKVIEDSAFRVGTAPHINFPDFLSVIQ
jgi:hypothetical protein